MNADFVFAGVWFAFALFWAWMSGRSMKADASLVSFLFVVIAIKTLLTAMKHNEK